MTLIEIESVACTSDETVELYKALVKFQMRALVVRKEANNTHFRSRYATLGDVLAIIQKPLAEDGLAVLQLPTPDGLMVTRLVHESGQWIQCVSAMNPVEVLIARGDANNPDRYGVTPQALGSAITYARRYALTALLNVRVDDEEDDDGNSASNTSGQPARAGSSRSSAPRQSAPASGSAAPAPKSEEDRLALMRSAITKDPISSFEGFTRFETAIVRHITSGGVSKENASGVIKLLAKQAALATPVTELVAKIGPKVLEMKDRGFISEADYLEVTAAFEEAASKNG